MRLDPFGKPFVVRLGPFHYLKPGDDSELPSLYRESAGKPDSNGGPVLVECWEFGAVRKIWRKPTAQLESAFREMIASDDERRLFGSLTTMTTSLLRDYCYLTRLPLARD
jgi:hypothetical protein